MRGVVLFSFVSVSLFIGCKKHNLLLDSTVVHGTVIDQTTGKGVPYAKLILKAWGSAGNWWSSGLYPIHELSADANGDYSFSFDHSIGPNGCPDVYLSQYILGAQAEHYWPLHVTEFIDIDTATVNTVNVPIPPIAWIELRVVNEPPATVYDVVVIDDFRCSQYGSPRLSGIDLDSTLICRTSGNESTSIKWSIRELDGSWSDYQGSLFCPALDTTYFEIRI